MKEEVLVSRDWSFCCRLLAFVFLVSVRHWHWLRDRFSIFIYHLSAVFNFSRLLSRAYRVTVRIVDHFMNSVRVHTAEEASDTGAAASNSARTRIQHFLDLNGGLQLAVHLLGVRAADRVASRPTAHQVREARLRLSPDGHSPHIPCSAAARVICTPHHQRSFSSTSSGRME